MGGPCYGVSVFSFGFMEIAVIGLLAVILFPPRELPKLARSVARFYGTIRRTADDFRAAIMEDPDLNEPIDEIKSAYRQTRWEVRRAEEAARRELAKARMEARMAVRTRGESKTSEATPRPAKTAGRVAAGELDDDLDLEEIDEPEDVHGPVGASAPPLPSPMPSSSSSLPPLPPPPRTPLAVARDPDDDPGGGRSDRSQGAA